MLSAAVFSALHVFALAIGLPAVFLRGRALKAGDLPRLFRADNVWALAALLWLGTGLTRVFGGLEKGSAYYLHSNTFWLKMSLFGLVLLLELYPMITFIRWRRAKATQVDPAQAALLAKLNHAELAVVCLMPFVASAMARGIGY